MRRTTDRLGLTIIFSLSAAGCGLDETHETAGPVDPAPHETAALGLEPAVVVPGNPTCADLGLGQFSFKIDPPTPGTYALDGALGGINTVTMTTSDGVYLDWTATMSIDAVIVKGGPMANVYAYAPEAASGSWLSPPINGATGWPYAISHVELCYDYEVAVSAVSSTSFMRRYTWSLEKTSPLSEVTLAVGETYAVPYQVTITPTGHVDTNFITWGTITVRNPAPFTADIASIVATIDGAPIWLDCGVTFPFPMASFDTLVCNYGVALPDPAARLLDVQVATAGPVGPGAASALIDFAGAYIVPQDSCMFLSDDLFGRLGSTCVAAGARTFAYQMFVGPYGACGEYSVVNTARVRDACAPIEDSWTVAVHVPCDVGCTLTQGYWKTHSSYGPAPYDATWAQLPNGADTPFFLSGASYYDVLWTVPRGNPYYSLAHAYIAAGLNGLNGASFSAIGDTYSEATELLRLYSPTAVATAGGAQGKALRARVTELAVRLDAYDNGLIGPGHCTE